MEISLSGICGPEDIITPVSYEDEHLRLDLGFRGAQNFKNHPGYYNHMPASEVKANISPEVWNNYFKFCFERNPWDKTVSHFFHRNKNKAFTGIMDYLQHDKKDMIKGFDMYSIDGEPVMDKVFKYEEMEAALAEISNTLGLNTSLKLPEYRAKSQFRTDKRHYRELLTKEEALIIAKKYSREIDLLGYTY